MKEAISAVLSIIIIIAFVIQMSTCADNKFDSVFKYGQIVVIKTGFYRGCKAKLDSHRKWFGDKYYITDSSCQGHHEWYNAEDLEVVK